MKKTSSLYSKTVSCMVCLSLIWVSPVYPFESISRTSSLSKKSAHAASFHFDLPQKLGRIKFSRDYAEGTKARPPVILIENAHTALDAQIKIDLILTTIEKSVPVDFIALEGGSGRLDLNLLRSFPDKKRLSRIFSQYLHRGDIPGSIYHAVTSRTEKNYVGIEDETLYQKQINSYFETLSLKEFFLDEINTLLADIQPLKEEFYSPSSQALDRLFQDYSETKNLASLVLFLEKYSRFIHASKTPNLYSFRKMNRKISNKSTSHKLSLEIAEMTDLLEKKYGKQLPEIYYTNKQDFKTEKMEPAQFAEFLIRVSSSQRFSTPISPFWQVQTSCYAHLKHLSPEALLDEINDTLIHAEKNLFSSEPALVLFLVTKHLLNLKKYASQTLTRNEWEELKKTLAIDPKNIFNQKNLQKQLNPSQSKYFQDILFHVEQLNKKTQKDYTAFTDFYTLSVAREKEFIANLSRYASAKESGSAILIAGGFHTQGLIETLSAQRIPFAVITPQISNIQTLLNYQNLMAGSVFWKRYATEQDAKTFTPFSAFHLAVFHDLFSATPSSQIEPLLQEWLASVFTAHSPSNDSERFKMYLRLIIETGIPYLNSKSYAPLRERWLNFVDHFLTLSTSPAFSAEVKTEFAGTAHAEPFKNITILTPNARLPFNWLEGRFELRANEEIPTFSQINQVAYWRDVKIIISSLIKYLEPKKQKRASGELPDSEWETAVKNYTHRIRALSLKLRLNSRMSFAPGRDYDLYPGDYVREVAETGIALLRATPPEHLRPVKELLRIFPSEMTGPNLDLHHTLWELAEDLDERLIRTKFASALRSSLHGSHFNEETLESVQNYLYYLETGQKNGRWFVEPNDQRIHETITKFMADGQFSPPPKNTVSDNEQTHINIYLELKQLEFTLREIFSISARKDIFENWLERPIIKRYPDIENAISSILAQWHSPPFYLLELVNHARMTLHETLNKNSSDPTEIYYLYHLDQSFGKLLSTVMTQLYADWKDQEPQIILTQATPIIKVTLQDLFRNGFISRYTAQWANLVDDEELTYEMLRDVLRVIQNEMNKDLSRWSLSYAEAGQILFAGDNELLDRSLATLRKERFALMAIMDILSYTIDVSNHVLPHDAAKPVNPGRAEKSTAELNRNPFKDIVHSDDFNDSAYKFNRRERRLYGGKGSYLLRMHALGLPVPSSFTISSAIMKSDLFTTHREEFVQTVLMHLEKLEADWANLHHGKKFRFGYAPSELLPDDFEPLILSIRSGAVFIMPGIFETGILVGLTPDILDYFIQKKGKLTAYHIFIRFIESLATSLGAPHEDFEKIYASALGKYKIQNLKELTAEQAQSLSEELLSHLKKIDYYDSFMRLYHSPAEQLFHMIRVTSDSWNNPKAVTYRKEKGYSNHWHTPVTVQAYVFGDNDEYSGTGIAASRDPLSGALNPQIEWIPRTEGFDHVQGRTIPLSGNILKQKLPAVYDELVQQLEMLDIYFGVPQMCEFTVESGSLWFLQTGYDHRNVAEELFQMPENENDISPDKRISTGQVAYGSIGILRGIAVMSPESILRGDIVKKLVDSNVDAIILLSDFPTPSETPSIISAANVLAPFNKRLILLTARGGLTSHAAVSANIAKIPTVISVHNMFMTDASHAQINGTSVSEGNFLTVDFESGGILNGIIPVKNPAPEQRSELRKTENSTLGFDMSRIAGHLSNGSLSPDDVSSIRNALNKLGTELFKENFRNFTDHPEWTAQFIGDQIARGISIPPYTSFLQLRATSFQQHLTAARHLSAQYQLRAMLKALKSSPNQTLRYHLIFPYYPSSDYQAWLISFISAIEILQKKFPEKISAEIILLTEKELIATDPLIKDLTLRAKLTGIKLDAVDQNTAETPQTIKNFLDKNPNAAAFALPLHLRNSIKKKWQVIHLDSITWQESYWLTPSLSNHFAMTTEVTAELLKKIISELPEGLTSLSNQGLVIHPAIRNILENFSNAKFFAIMA